MTAQSFAAPVAKLLELGQPKYSRNSDWPDYHQFGIGPEHITELISLAVDQELLAVSDESDARGWGPVHAWRALGQLHSVEAIEPLLRLFHEICDNDWVIEEMPDVFALIGPAAFPALCGYLSNPVYPTYSRLVAATSLAQIALLHGDLRGAAVAALVEQLKDYKSNSPGTNGVIIANLVDLQAAEHSDLIHKVFAESKVDRFIAGDWRDVKLRLRGQPPRGSIPNETNLKKMSANTPPDPAHPPYNEPRTSPDPSRSAYREPRTTPRGNLY